ncbi:MAG: hypothetical protein RR058_07430 [Oscillospiraceae bacterium]
MEVIFCLICFMDGVALGFGIAYIHSYKKRTVPLTQAERADAELQEKTQQMQEQLDNLLSYKGGGQKQ